MAAALAGAACVWAAVRHGLELAASGPGSNPREVVIALVLNSVGAVVLVGGLWLVRQQLRADRRAQREDELGQASVRPDVVASSDVDPSRAE